MHQTTLFYQTQQVVDSGHRLQTELHDFESTRRPPKGGASAAALINLAKGRLPGLETAFLPTTSTIPRFPLRPYPCVSLGHRKGTLEGVQ